MALFESYERRIDKINEVLGSYGIASIEEAEKITKDAGLDVYNQVKGIQPICFENACWAYTVGAAIAIKKGCKTAADAAAAIGEGLQAFCIPGSVADQRKVGLGHGNLGKMLLEEDTDCFAFLAGHESFAAAEGAIGIAEKANKVRKKPLRVILNGLGKDAAKIISRINGFTYVQTEYDYYTGELKEVQRIAYSDGLRSKVNCYGANDVREGVAIMHKEGVDAVSYTHLDVYKRQDVGGAANKWIALVIFAVASLTDMLDGKIARARGLVTNFGKFMDPLADKLLVCSAMICMISTGQLEAWFVIIIIAREFIISGFRLVAADSGIVIAASYWGKFKTVSQMFMVIVLIMDLGGVFDVIGTVLIWVSLILTIVSLIDYVAKNIQVLTKGGM